MSAENFDGIPKSDSEQFQRPNVTNMESSIALKYRDNFKRDERKTRGSRRTGDPKCLAKAIQNNMVELVNDMHFKESSIPDELIAEGCITEDECKLVRDKKDRKGQVRKIVNLIKGRNFSTIEKFLKIVGKDYPTIIGKIWSHYNELMETNSIADGCCGVCKVKRHVCVTYVMDILWQEHAISDSLYEQLCDVDAVKGHQENAWDAVFAECNENNKLETVYVALESKGHYSHIAKELRTQSHLGTSIGCACFRPGDIYSPHTPNSLTSYLPNSSHSDSQSSFNRNDTVDTEETGEPEYATERNCYNIPSDKVVQSDGIRLIPSDNEPNETGKEHVKIVETDTCFPMFCFPCKKGSKV